MQPAKAASQTIGAGALLGALGLAEWALTSDLGADLGQATLLRGALLACGPWALIGGAAGILAAPFARGSGHAALMIGVGLGLGVAARTGSDPSASHLAAWAGAASVAVVGALVARRLLRGLLAPPALLAALAAAGGGVLALAAAAAPDAGHGGLLAGAGALAAVGLALAGLVRGRSRVAAGGVVTFLVSALPLAMLPAPQSTGGAAPDAPGVLLVTIDTLRADRLGAAGHAAARTPVLDRLAAEGVWFEEAVTAVGYTGPSHASLLTGLLPDRHAVVRNGQRLGPQVEDLATRLGREGYATAAFVSGWTVTDEASGLPSRFREFGDAFGPLAFLPEAARHTSPWQLVARLLRAMGRDPSPPRRPAAEVTREARAWLARHRGRPFFLWVHYFDPHLPYRPPPRFLDEAARSYRGPADGRWYALDSGSRARLLADPAAVAQMKRLYDAAVASVDHAVGRLLDRARAAAPQGRLLTFVTADHGESFGEHDVWWDRDLYDVTTRIPWIAHGFGVEASPGTRVHRPVRSVDLAPTLLELLGLTPRDGLDGRSLAGVLRGVRDEPPAEPALSIMAPWRNELPAAALRTGSFKVIRREPGLIRNRLAPLQIEVYDLARDPEETRDLAARPPPEAQALLEALEARARAQTVNGSQEQDGSASPHVSRDQRDMLRALGYAE